jgi:hypothetical protein
MLWIDHIKDSVDIAADTSWMFLSWAHPLVSIFAIGIHKVGIDYDDVNARMAPDNRATATTVLAQLENWDNGKQLAAQEQHDPLTKAGESWRPGAIDISSCGYRTSW